MRILITILLSACLSASTLARSETRDIRAIWITRFDYRSADDVRAAITNSLDAGFNRIMFQVRGNATAFYPSRYEPWAEQLDWQDPGFDPLALALELTHARGAELHAWVNVVPAWWGTRPPENERHVFHTHPEWFWYDQYDNRQALCERFYVSLNPCLPEVQQYLVDVVADVAERYGVDGLHLDYMRFPNEPPATPAEGEIDYPRDERTLELFAAATQTTPERSPLAWDRWRCAQITQLLKRIRTRVKNQARAVELSVAVGPDPERALEHFQDYRTWIREDLIDALYPMNYTAAPASFGARLTRWRALAQEVDVVMGVMLGSGDLELRGQQLGLARERFGAVCVFAYSAFFDSPNTEIDRQDAESTRLRAQRRRALLPLKPH